MREEQFTSPGHFISLLFQNSDLHSWLYVVSEHISHIFWCGVAALFWLWLPRTRMLRLYYVLERNECSSSHPYKFSVDETRVRVKLFPNPNHLPDLNFLSLSLHQASALNGYSLRLRIVLSSREKRAGFHMLPSLLCCYRTHCYSDRVATDSCPILFHIMLHVFVWIFQRQAVSFRTGPHYYNMPDTYVKALIYVINTMEINLNSYIVFHTLSFILTS